MTAPNPLLARAIDATIARCASARDPETVVAIGYRVLELSADRQITLAQFYALNDAADQMHARVIGPPHVPQSA